MDPKSMKSMMYWSAVFRDDSLENLNDKISKSVFEEELNLLEEMQPNNPLKNEIEPKEEDKDINKEKQEKKSERDSPNEEVKSDNQKQKKSFPNEVKETMDTVNLLQDMFKPKKQEQITGRQFGQWKQVKQKWGSHLQKLNNSENKEKDTESGKGTGFGKRGDFSPSNKFEILDYELEAILEDLETEMIEKMDLSDILTDDDLVDQMEPQLGMVEQLLFQKDNLSGKAMVNAKRLIRNYVNQLVDKFKFKVEKSIIKIPDPDVVPKRTFRNLDIKRTIWTNLPNWDAEEKKLYVDRLHFYRASKKTLPTKLIVVVDQSGSMVPAMIQTTILASVFSGLPKVEVELFAFDTKVVNLTQYVHDPFEVLLQTNLGGGTNINNALDEARKSISDPKNTGVILITDYFEGGSEEALFDTIESIQENGAKFISVVSMDQRGRVAYNGKFTNRLEKIDIPSISGGPDDLINKIQDVL